MLKYVGNLIFSRSFTKILTESEALNRIYFRQNKFTSNGYFCSRKFGNVYAGRYVVPSKFQQQKVFLIKEAVTLSGILSFLGLKKEEEPLDPQAELILTIKKGILLIQREQFEKAEQMLHSALKMAQDQNDADGVIYVYDVLANLAFETGQHKKAEKLFVNVLQKIIAKGEAQDSNKVVHISLKLAKIFEDTKEYNKAEQGYKFCIDCLDKKLEEEDEDTLALWGMSMDWYARFLLNTNRKSDALSCFKKAYEMCVKVNGVEHEQTVVLLNDLGTVSSLIGDNESALSYLEEARDIGAKLPDMKDLASIYINLGQLYLLREMYKESKSACEEGLKKARVSEDKVASSEALQCLENINKVFRTSEATKDNKSLGKVLVN